MKTVKRIGIYFKLKQNKREAYIRAHENIWPAMREVLSEAGVRNYSIWNLGDDLFAYYETDHEERMQAVLDSSEVYAGWRDMMEDFVYKDENGRKEWPMEMVFFNQGQEKEDS